MDFISGSRHRPPCYCRERRWSGTTDNAALCDRRLRLLGIRVRLWHIASFRCAAEFGRYRGIADSDNPSITCVIGVNAVSALGQHFNQIAADAIADCIGGQILQSMPVFARMSSGELDPNSIAIQIAMAFIGSTLLTFFPIILSKLRARPHSRFLCLALPLSKSGAEYPKDD